MARLVILFAIVILAVCVVYTTSKKTSPSRRVTQRPVTARRNTIRTTRRSSSNRNTTPRRRITVRPKTTRKPIKSKTTKKSFKPKTTKKTKPNYHVVNFYMGSSSHCSRAYPMTHKFELSNKEANVRAWSLLPLAAPTGSCAMSFDSYSTERLQFKFSKLSITDCKVKIEIYKGSRAFGKPAYTYNCTNTKVTPPPSAPYRTSTNGFVTIRLDNPTNSRGFDFLLNVQSYRPKVVYSGGESMTSAVWLVLAAIVVHLHP